MIKNTIILFVLFVFGTNSHLLGQVEQVCGTPSTPPNTPINVSKVNSCDATCPVSQEYAPNEFYPHHRPIVNIRVNIHFIQRTDGSGNFTETHDGHGNTNRNGIVIANEMISVTNALLASNQQTLTDQTQYGCDFGVPGYVGEPTYLQTQFRFVLEPYPNDPNNTTGVYFHQSDLHYEDNNWQSKSRA